MSGSVMTAELDTLVLKHLHNSEQSPCKDHKVNGVSHEDELPQNTSQWEIIIPCDSTSRVDE